MKHKIRARGYGMKRLILDLLVALNALTFISCAGYRQLGIESTEPASVVDWGGAVVCARTPCVMRVSRETCGIYDSSKGHIILTARSENGLTMVSMAIPTCDVKDGMRLRYEFPSGKGVSDCAVILLDGDREQFRLPCRETLGKKPWIKPYLFSCAFLIRSISEEIFSGGEVKIISHSASE
jgi:hypothetical protein